MGQPRKKVRRTKKSRPVTKIKRRRRKTRFRLFSRRTLIVGLILFIGIYISQHVFKPANYFEESEALYKLLSTAFTERTGVITEIKKTSEVLTRGGAEFKRWTIHVEIMDGVALDKLWMGISANLPDLYQIKKKLVTESGRVSFVNIAIEYKRHVFAYVTLYHKKTRPQKKIAKPQEKKSITESLTSFFRLPFHQEPSIAFIIDDIGYNRDHEALLFSLPREVTFSILPHLSHSEYFSQEGYRRGYDIMLHLPCEAEKAYINPGPGTIYIDMGDEQIRTTFREDIESISHVCGVNNHMGSRVTADYRVMKTIFNEVEKRKLFFIDSYTTEASVISRLTHEMQVPMLKRDVFLDNTNDPAYIKGQIELLIQHAKEQGYAIGIGHYRRNTLQSIIEMTPEIEKEGVQLIRVRKLIK